MKEKAARKRKPPTQLILSEEFKQHMEERMKSEEDKRAQRVGGHHCRAGLRANAAGLAARAGLTLPAQRRRQRLSRRRGEMPCGSNSPPHARPGSC
jgi:regulator of protease activity HflC (stomatin/prohibitin superfamily)